MPIHEDRIEYAKKKYREGKISLSQAERIIEAAYDESGPYFGAWVLSQAEVFRTSDGTIRVFGKEYEQHGRFFVEKRNP